MRISLSILFVAALMMADPAIAEDAAGGEDGARRGQRRGGPRGEHPTPAQIIEKFDNDGDGTLSEAEKAEAHKARDQHRTKRRAELMKKFDTDGDGKISDAERAQIRKHMRERRGGEGKGQAGPGGKGRGKGQACPGGKGRGPRGDRPSREEIINKFDKDGDGKLTEAERAEAHKAMEAHRAERKAEVMKKFDTDGDGKISDAERAQIRKHMRKRRGSDGKGRRGPPDKRGGEAEEAIPVAE